MNGNGNGPKVLQIQPWPQPCDACGELSVMFQTVSHQNPLATGLSLPSQGKMPVQAQFQGEVAFALCLNCGYHFKCDVDRKTSTRRRLLPMALKIEDASEEEEPPPFSLLPGEGAFGHGDS